MAEGVVDRFKMIQIAKENRETTPFPIGPRDLFVCAKIKITAVVESRQSIEIRLPRQRLFGLLPFDDFILKHLIGGFQLNGPLENPALQQLIYFFVSSSALSEG